MHKISELERIIKSWNNEQYFAALLQKSDDESNAIMTEYNKLLYIKSKIENIGEGEFNGEDK